MLKLKNDGYVFVSKLGIEYELLEGVSIGAEKRYTSDVFFIMLNDPNYNVDNNIVDYLFGVSCIKTDLEEYEESIGNIIDKFEKRNFNK